MSDPIVLPPHKIAFVLDGVVQDVLHVDDRLAAILLSDPLLVDATQYYEDKDQPFNVVNWTFEDGNLIPAEVHVAQPTV